MPLRLWRNNNNNAIIIIGVALILLKLVSCGRAATFQQQKTAPDRVRSSIRSPSFQKEQEERNNNDNELLLPVLRQQKRRKQQVESEGALSSTPSSASGISTFGSIRPSISPILSPQPTISSPPSDLPSVMPSLNPSSAIQLSSIDLPITPNASTPSSYSITTVLVGSTGEYYDQYECVNPPPMESSIPTIDRVEFQYYLYQRPGTDPDQSVDLIDRSLAGLLAEQTLTCSYNDTMRGRFELLALSPVPYDVRSETPCPIENMQDGANCFVVSAAFTITTFYLNRDAFQPPLPQPDQNQLPPEEQAEQQPEEDTERDSEQESEQEPGQGSEEDLGQDMGQESVLESEQESELEEPEQESEQEQDDDLEQESEQQLEQQAEQQSATGVTLRPLPPLQQDAQQEQLQQGIFDTPTQFYVSGDPGNRRRNRFLQSQTQSQVFQVFGPVLDDIFGSNVFSDFTTNISGTEFLGFESVTSGGMVFGISESAAQLVENNIIGNSIAGFTGNEGSASVRGVPQWILPFISAVGIAAILLVIFVAYNRHQKRRLAELENESQMNVLDHDSDLGNEEGGYDNIRGTMLKDGQVEMILEEGNLKNESGRIGFSGHSGRSSHRGRDMDASYDKELAESMGHDRRANMDAGRVRRNTTSRNQRTASVQQTSTFESAPSNDRSFDSYDQSIDSTMNRSYDTPDTVDL